MHDLSDKWKKQTFNSYYLCRKKCRAFIAFCMSSNRCRYTDCQSSQTARWLGKNSWQQSFPIPDFFKDKNLNFHLLAKQKYSFGLKNMTHTLWQSVLHFANRFCTFPY
jgi:hypothetical protein